MNDWRAAVEERLRSYADDRDKTYDLIGRQVRQFSGGILALGWGFVLESTFIAAEAVVAPIALALAALLFDFLEQVSGYLNSRECLSHVERLLHKPAAAQEPPPPERFLSLRRKFLWFKIICTLLAVTSMITVVTTQLVN